MLLVAIVMFDRYTLVCEVSYKLKKLQIVIWYGIKEFQSY